MSVLVDKNTRLLVQGITGNSGAFHARGCRDYGTNVVAGVTPGKGGQFFDDSIPIFDTVHEAREATGLAIVTEVLATEEENTLGERAVQSEVEAAAEGR